MRTTFEPIVLPDIRPPAAPPYFHVMAAARLLQQHKVEFNILCTVHAVNGDFREQEAPEKLPDNDVTILLARGSTYFAAARTIQDMLPSAKESHRSVVIARLRGMAEVGITMISIMERYATELRANGGRLMLSDVHENVLAQLLRTETTESIPEDAIFMATDILGQSTKEAYAAAQAWLAKGEQVADTD